MFNVDSKLFEIASRFASTETTRYYLNGVYIEPCEAGGVAIVATDGHCMFVAFDVTGAAAEPLIVALNKDMLRACKKAKTLSTGYDGDGELPKIANLEDGEGAPIMSGPVGFVDGTFPDWRRVIPSCKPHESNQVDVFNGKYMADMGKAAIDLAKREGARCGFCRIIPDALEGSPALVEFDHGPAFAVLMPARETGSSAGLGIMDRINFKAGD